MDIDWRGRMLMLKWQGGVKVKGHEFISNRFTRADVIDGGSVEDESISIDEGEMR